MKDVTVTVRVFGSDEEGWNYDVIKKGETARNNIGYFGNSGRKSVIHLVGVIVETTLQSATQ